MMKLWKPDASTTPTEPAPWTTVMAWNKFKGEVVYQGDEYKSKESELEKLIGLPFYVRVPLKVAAGSIYAPLKRLTRFGWDVIDGPNAIPTPGDYQEFVARPRGEFSIAKHVYATMRTGCLNYRSACYVSAGRPVVLQDTGFSKFIPTGEGLLAFSTTEETVDVIHQVEANYERHTKAARSIAEEYFDLDKVLNQLIEEAMDSDG